MGASADLEENYRAVMRAVTANGVAELAELIADDVQWNGGQPPAGFTGRETFFAVVEKFRAQYATWKVEPLEIVSRDNIVMSHQLDSVTLPDGTAKAMRFNLYMRFNDEHQLQEVWEFGGQETLMVDVPV